MDSLAGSATTPNFFAQAWAGQAPLWQVFWLYTALGSALVRTALNLLVGFGVLPFSFAQLLAWVFALSAVIFIWRCAFNCSQRVWGHLARALVLLQVLAYSGTRFLGCACAQLFEGIH